MARLLRRKFPDALIGKTEDEIFGIGTFRVLPVSCPLIEIAEDGNTAKGLWYCQGAHCEVTGGGPTSGWTWGYYAADFVREDDGWKIWHLQYTNDVDCRGGKSWGIPYEPLPELADFAELSDFRNPEYSVPAVLREPYSPTRPLTGAPNQYNPNPFPIGDGFGLLLFFERFEDTHFRNGVVKRPTSKPRGPRKPKNHYDWRIRT